MSAEAGELHTTVRIGQAPDPAGTLVSNALGTPSTNMARFRIRLSGCTANITGLNYPATVTVNCDWTISPLSYNSATGQSALRLRLGYGSPSPSCTMVIALTGSPCTVTVPDQIISSGITGQNVNAAGLATPPAGGPPAGLRVSVNIPGGANPPIAWTQTGCPGLPAGPPPYAGLTVAFYLPGIWVVP